MQRFLIHLLVSATSLGVTAWILPGVRIESIPALLAAALVLGVLNALVRPLLLFLTLPLTLLTLGLFFFVLNGFLFGLAAWLVPGFEVGGIGWAILGALLMGFFAAFLHSQIGGGRRGRAD